MGKKDRFVAAAAALVVIMVVFFVFMVMPSMFGKEVLLPLRPVDPFDPLRGQYLILSYSMNRPQSIGLENLTQGESVYVLLEANSTGISNPVKAQAAWMDAGLGQTVIKGRYENGMIYYGIESFFMERGSRLDSTLDGAYAKIKVLPDGRASVVGLQKDGKSLEFIPRGGSFLQR